MGRELLGYVLLARQDDVSPWTHEEQEAVMEVGRTLGRVVLNARLYGRERQLVGELQELDRYKGELIATISHELKTPLTSIIGHVELLEDLDTGIGSVEAISRNAERLNRLVQNLLNYSQIQDQRDTVRMPVDLRKLAEQSLELMAMQAEQGSVTMTLEIPDEPVMVTADPDELGKVIDNLTSNAVKYTLPGRLGRRRGGHRRGSTPSCCAPTPASASPPPTRCTCSRPSTAPATPRRSRSRAPAWAWRSRGGSPRCTAARSWWPPSSARAAPSGSGCRCSSRPPAPPEAGRGPAPRPAGDTIRCGV